MDVHPEVVRLADAIAARMDEIVDQLTDRVVADIEPYRTDLVSRDELRRSMAHNVGYVVERLRGGCELDLSAPRETGRQRARAGLPLPELLRAYRLGFADLWAVLVEQARLTGSTAYAALVDTATYVWSLADDYSLAVTDAYRDAQADRMFEEARQRSALIEAVLTGDSVDHGTLWEVAERLRIPFEGAFLVVAAETGSIGANPLGRVEPRLAALDISSGWRLLPGLELGLLSLRTSSRLPDALAVITTVAHTRIGVSPVFGQLDGAPNAARLARIAMTSVPASTVAVHQFDTTALGVLAAADPDTSRRVAHTVLGDIVSLPAEDRDTLLATLETWLDAKGSATETGKLLYVHPNTVRHRLRRIEQHTGRSLNDLRAIGELTMAMTIVRIFPDTLG
ncbi:MAG TPA: helix-turn-helix domain-containing protein [Pseudonocardiaceae bacterium]|jgi:hypothetical protein|nr:helix-turn-helix domain-containing protein [Pseudonocardiaceae bacterium]